MQPVVQPVRQPVASCKRDAWTEVRDSERVTDTRVRTGNTHTSHVDHLDTLSLSSSSSSPGAASTPAAAAVAMTVFYQSSDRH